MSENAEVNVTYRRANENDFRSILALWIQQRDTQAKFDQSLYTFSEEGTEIRLRTIKGTLPQKSESGVTFLAEVGGSVIGYFVGTIQSGHAFYVRPASGFIFDTFVAKEFRRQGIMEALRLKFEVFLKDLNISILTAWTIGNNEPVIEASKKLGYEVVRVELLKRLDT